MARISERVIFSVDNDETQRISIIAALEPDFKVHFFNNPVQVLFALEHNAVPLLVATGLSKIEMPNMEGIVFAERIQEICGRKDPPITMPIIVISTDEVDTQPDLWARFQNAGAVAYFRKPINPPQLYRAVTEHLNK